MSADFMSRFKGKTETTDRHGLTNIVTNSTNPIKAPTYGEPILSNVQPSQNTRMNLDAIQRNYLNFPNHFEQQMKQMPQTSGNQQYMPMLPVFMPPIYDVNQMHYMQQGMYAQPQMNPGYPNMQSFYPQVN